MEDGKVLLTKQIPTPKLQPKGSTDITIEGLPATLASGAEYFVRFRVQQKENTLWENAGYEVATEQLKWTEAPKTIYPTPTGNLTVQNNSSNILVSGSNFVVEFSKSSGTLVKYTLNEKALISEPLQLNVFRAGTENDKDQSSSWNAMGLRSLSVEAGTFKITEADAHNAVDLAINNTYSGNNKTTFATQTLFKVLSDGTILVSNLIDPSVKNVVLPRIGYILEMPQEYESLTWYGRGPGESYPDRKESELIGVYNTSVTSQWVDYLLPQEMCSKQDVRWISLANKEGTGLLFVAPETMAAGALHYRPEDFFISGNTRIKHPYQMKLRKNTVVYLDAKQRPLGNASCGSGPLEQYELRAETTIFNFMILPMPTALSKDQLSEKARVGNPVCSPVKIKREHKGKVSLSTTTPNGKIYYSINQGKYKIYTAPFDLLNGGHIDAYSEATGCFNSPATSADLNLFIDKSKWKVVGFSSQASGEEAVKAIDEKPNTIWHTQWGDNEPNYPHEIVVDMAKRYKVEAFIYQGRPDGDNGRIKEYEVYFSNNPKEWGSPAAKGRLTNTTNPQSIKIDSKPEARYFKFVAVSEMRGRTWASAAELGIEAAGSTR
ncbi:hypothetical protein FACS1894160_4780 [Bacteroidia bacterium]|nr:hypothetical protein FACS1894160_4780 [Bacteroidia bacterium]